MTELIHELLKYNLGINFLPKKYIKSVLTNNVAKEISVDWDTYSKEMALNTIAQDLLGRNWAGVQEDFDKFKKDLKKAYKERVQ